VKVADLETINRESLRQVEIAHASKRTDPLPNPPYYGYVDVDIFECPSFVMFINNDSPVVSNILCHRRFEPTSLKLWCRLTKSATGILDIGANVGVYSLVAAALRSDVAIHAFEANPFAYARLRLHKMINNFINISEHTFAVGNENRATHFSWVVKPGGNISSGGSAGDEVTFHEAYKKETILVEMHSLDGTGLAAQLGSKPLIKIDVEGGEVPVMVGMKEILALKPDIIIESFVPQSCDAINNYLMPMGYSAYLIEEEAGKVTLRDKLYPAKVAPPFNFNQLLTTRPHAEIEALMA